MPCVSSTSDVVQDHLCRLSRADELNVHIASNSSQNGLVING